MAAAQVQYATDADQRFGDLAKLICKLRRIGLEDEARTLQAAISTLPFRRYHSMRHAHD